MFGGAKPAAGFGAFGGGNNAFGGGGAFGNNNAAPATTSAFGQPANNTSAFGQANPMFGKPATTAFGAPAGTHFLASVFPVVECVLASNATGTYDNVPAVTAGSSNPPYAPFSEKDPATAGLTNNYQSISCMPAYRGTSFEEIRLQDYAQGRKTAGAFGQSAAFGGVQQPTTSIFGQAQPAQQTSVFGGGATQPTTGFGAFGNPTPAAAAPAFGASAFGQPQQQQPAAGFGAFGQQQPQQQQQTSVFGGGTANAFGNNNAAKPFGAFGSIFRFVWIEFQLTRSF
jgi:nuclear pore complex protein Nup98-Nup96